MMAASLASPKANRYFARNYRHRTDATHWSYDRKEELTAMEFTELIDLASERLGGAVLFANDEFFAPKENLLKPSPPVFIEGKYTDLGKWMDGWETRRRRTPGHDWSFIRLRLPAVPRAGVAHTAHIKGNY